MSINLTDEIEVKTKKGKLGAAKQIFLEGDTQTVENEIQNINSRHNDLNSKHESLSSTVSEHTNQIESNQNQIIANKSTQDAKNASLDANMAELNTRDDQITELVRGITATGGASVATTVTYDNTSSHLASATVQGAIDELQGSKIDKTSILQKLGNAEDKVMSQNAVSDALSTKVDKTDITQSTGTSTTAVMSQKAVSDIVNELESQVIYDVTANNDGVTFGSLSALLSDENLSTLIPSTVRCGGMSIRFIQSSDNKYVQYRLMSDSWSAVVTNWQGVDDEPTEGSPNIVKSIGVYRDYIIQDQKIKVDNPATYLGIFKPRNNIIASNIWVSSGKHIIVPVMPNSLYKIIGGAYNSAYAFLTADEPVVVESTPLFCNGYTTAEYIYANTAVSIETPSDCKYLYLLIESSGIVVTPVYFNIVNNIEGEIANINSEIADINSETYTLRGKILSVMGDSISTYAGKIPSGYVSQYPNQNQPTIISFFDTWVGRLLALSGMQLGVLNSYAGTRVSTTGNLSNYSMCKDARINNLGSPDIIVVFGGNNDVWQDGSPAVLGEIPSLYADEANYDLTTFSGAYLYMLKKMRQTYPNALIFCVGVLDYTRWAGTGYKLNSQNYSKQIASKIIKECVEMVGGKFIDISACGINTYNFTSFSPDQIHPNALGMKIICDYVYQFIKNNIFHDIKTQISISYEPILGTSIIDYATGAIVTAGANYWRVVDNIEIPSGSYIEGEINVYYNGSNLYACAVAIDENGNIVQVWGYDDLENKTHDGTVYKGLLAVKMPDNAKMLRIGWNAGQNTNSMDQPTLNFYKVS